MKLRAQRVREDNKKDLKEKMKLQAQRVREDNKRC